MLNLIQYLLYLIELSCRFLLYKAATFSVVFGIVKMMTVLLIFNPEVIVLCTFKYLKTSNTLLPREFQWSDKIGTTLMQFSTSLNPTVTSLINIK